MAGFEPTISRLRIRRLKPACLHRRTLGEVDGSRTHLVLIDSEVPLPLGHHFNAWYPARDSNPNLNVRSVLSLSIGRTGPIITRAQRTHACALNWYRRGESNSRPLIEGQR